MQEPSSIAQVAVELPVHKALDYHLPPALRAACQIGQRVLVPVGNRQVLGYIVALHPSSPLANLKDVSEVLDDSPLLTPDLLRLTHWIAEYYLCPWGQVLKAAIPEGFRVQSAAVYTLTPKAQVDSQVWPEGRLRDILQCLSDYRALRRDQLADKLGTPHLGAWLQRLQEEHWIDIEQRRLPPKTRQRLVAMVRLCVAPSQAHDMQQRLLRRAPNQAAVLRLLAEQPEWELAALRTRLPGAAAAVKGLKQQGLVDLVQVEKRRQVVPATTGTQAPPLHLNPAQHDALQTIERKLATPDGVPILLHGVTGSGKTEVYIRAIARVLQQRRSALLLVPEISLTTQLVERFAGRFPSDVAVLHSGLSAGERFDEWRRIASGEARIAIGARSAVFAPLRQIGLIIVDEEHDTSYKQEETPRYHGRDVAIVRAHQCQAVVVLGSATPSLESFHHASQGKYLLQSLPHRVEDKPLPQITIIDQRTQPMPNARVISNPLHAAIGQCLQRQEQGLILINRRGFAAYLQCRTCGAVPQCVRCSVSLTYHRHYQTLKCHYCDFSQRVPEVCPGCQGTTLQPFGLGTQQVEDALKALFPQARLARMDRDTTRGKTAHQQILGRLGRGDLDLLVGTQMIAKGHDYPNITLVGVVSADAALAIPDFRSPERLFQLLTQVAGRAGRGQAPGEVLIQTYRPEHYSVRFARHHDFVGFYNDELQRRQDMAYPPFTRLARLVLESTDAKRTQTAIQWLSQVLRDRTPNAPARYCTLLGPAEAPVARIHNRYRWHLLLKGTTSRLLHDWLGRALVDVQQNHAELRGVKLIIDIDPVTFL